jgi:SWI/SNF-related matrix-associated actin-dependent regulator 1 of chromatin subfamily A
MIRRRKKDVLKDLPSVLQSVVPLDVKNVKEYRQKEAEMRAWLTRAGGYDTWDTQKKNHAMVQAGELRREAALLKLDAVYEWIDNFLESTKEKLIVYGIHKKMIRALRERYEGKCVTVTGSTPDHKRKVNFETFNANKKCRLFFGNIQAAGTGWSARSCSHVAYVEISYVPADHAQAGARVHGVGRGQEGVRSNEHWLVAKGTAEEKLCRIVQKKSRNIDLAVDGKLHGEMDVFKKYLAALREV